MTVSCVDHIGNSFRSYRDMCKYWGIDAQVFRRRQKTGWSLEKALTGKDGRKTEIKDHLGNTYQTINDMAKAYGMKPTTLQYRLLSMSVKQALETPVRLKKNNKDKKQ